jgi:hypothetical protein
LDTCQHSSPCPLPPSWFLVGTTGPGEEILHTPK